MWLVDSQTQLSDSRPVMFHTESEMQRQQWGTTGTALTTPNWYMFWFLALVVINIYVFFSVIWLIVGGITTREKDVQLFILAAHQLGKVNGDNVFLHIELYPDPGYTKPWMPVLIQQEERVNFDPDELQNILVEAFEALVMLTYRYTVDNTYVGSLWLLSGV